MGNITTKANNGDVVISCAGALNWYMADDLRQRLYSACESADTVTVDMRSVDILDSAIEASLARGAVLMNGRGKRLRLLVSVSSQPSRRLRITCIDSLLDMEEAPAV